jgi:RNA polymerase sigma-B factor
VLLERERTDLLAEYDSLAVRLARQFHTHRELRDDLEQVARIGLMHAADRFDPSRERPFAAYARATIIGELKRHLRDSSWSMRLPRSLHDCYLLVVGVLDDMTQELGRAPRIPEVAARTGLTEEQVVEAMEVRLPLSIDVPIRGDRHSMEPAAEDSWFERLEDGSLLTSLLARLTPHQRQVVSMYFFDGMPQVEIARRMGVSQMAISRLLARCLAQMRKQAAAQGVRA